MKVKELIDFVNKYSEYEEGEVVDLSFVNNTLEICIEREDRIARGRKNFNE